MRPTTEAPETTTKKKGFFSGWFGGKKEESTTISSTSTSTSTTSVPTTTSTTVRTTSSSTTQKIVQIPTFSTTLRTPSRNDNFPPLPPPSGQPSSSPFQPKPPANFPNAWNVPPQIPTDKPVSFFTQPLVYSTSTTKKPQAHVHTPSDGKVTDAELLTLSDSLFSKDINNPFRYVTVNYQERTQSSATGDFASQP